MNTANNLNLTLNLIFQGQEVTIPTLKVPTLSIETINLLGVNTLENPIELNSFSDSMKKLKADLTTDFQMGIGFKVLVSLSVGTIIAVALTILGLALPILELNVGCVLTIACGLTGMMLMLFLGPLTQNDDEQDASSDLGTIIDFFLENDPVEKLQNKILTEPENIDLKNALQEVKNARKFYSKYAKMRAPNISPASKEILRQKCIDLDLDDSAFDQAVAVNSAWEKLSDSIQKLKSQENYHTHHMIAYLAPLTLLVGAFPWEVIGLKPLTYVAGMIGLCIALRGLLNRTLLEEDVRANRLAVEQMTSRLKTFFSDDFEDLREVLEDENEEKALRELDRVVAYYTNLPEPEPRVEQGWTFSRFLDSCQRGETRNGRIYLKPEPTR